MFIAVEDFWMSGLLDERKPIVNLTSQPSAKISAQTGYDTYPYTFSADEPGQAWEVRVVTNTSDTRDLGTLVESGGAIASGDIVAGSITYAELISAGAASALRAAVLSDGPVAYWPLDETTGTTAFDISGNGHHATYVGSPTLGNTALTLGGKPNPLFNGTSQRVDLPAMHLADNGDVQGITYTGWFRGTGTSTDLWVVSESSTSNNNPLIGFKLQSGKLQGFFRGDASTPSAVATSTANYNDGNPYLGAMTWTPGAGSGIRIRIGGSQVGVAAAAVSTRTTTNTTIGALARVGPIFNGYFPGVIGHVALFDKVLSATRTGAYATAGTSVDGSTLILKFFVQDLAGNWSI
jgi:hypothetical protein